MKITNHILIAPAGETIAQSTFMDWLKKNGLSPMDRLTSSQEEEVNRIAAADPVTIAAIAARAESLAKSATEDDAKESEISRITDGLDRETVMAMAMKKLRDGRGYWPAIDGDTLTVADTNDQKIVWTLGHDGWSQPISTRGNRDDDGAGYGANQ